MLLDIGFGLIAALLSSNIFHVHISPLILLMGALFAILPDIDFPFEWLSRGTVGGKRLGFHRELTHYPLIYLPTAWAIYFIFGAMWTTLFAVCILFHFIHDSLGMGWGIKWLWPIKMENYKFFSDKDGVWSKNIIVSWEPTELKQTVAEHGDPDWIKHYITSPTFILEIIILAAALFILKASGAL